MVKIIIYDRFCFVFFESDMEEVVFLLFETAETNCLHDEESLLFFLKKKKNCFYHSGLQKSKKSKKKKRIF